ncbi:hypothetical protein H072_9450 [Dactylellina haptotyla CBS 200.50]|uniref:Uncharacterized protein n=1 Tax=Dactylellina haptotyla (strain CBS 200.50) TaxID=1284197 RepID=S8A1Y2_DACHA|nr:hypothetical protein H072_9450 [Dactylellina haptotyla CBS 200.50]
MLGVRQASNRILSRQKVIQSASPSPIHQWYLYSTSVKAALKSKSAIRVSRVTDILRIQTAFEKVLLKEELDGCTSDDQRRDLLWGTRQQLAPLFPGRRWDKVYGVGRRLLEKGYLGGLSEKAARTKLLSVSPTALAELEGVPKWLKREISQMYGDEKVKDDDEVISTDMTADSSDNTETEPQSIVPNTGGTLEDANDLIQYEIPKTPVSKLKATPVQPQSVAQNAQDAAVKARLEKVVSIPTPDQKKIMAWASTEEDYTMEKLSKLKIQEEETSPEMKQLQGLSKVLIEKDVRPDLKPVFYPNQAAFAVLTEATTLLEEACYQYVARTTPSVTQWPAYDCPEAQELKRWVDLISKLAREYKKTLALPPQWAELSTYGLMIRNAAAHRLPISAPKLRELLKRSREWIDLLEVPEIAEKYAKIEEIAAKMQYDLESALEPVTHDIMGSLEFMKKKYGEIGKLEEQIRSIKHKIAAKVNEIETEDNKLVQFLEKGQQVRFEEGKNFNREELRNYLYSEPVEEILVEETPDEVTPAEDVPSEASFKSEESPTELSTEDIREMLAREDATFSEVDMTYLRRDGIAGLVSLSNNTLKDIEEVGDQLDKPTDPTPAEETLNIKGNTLDLREYDTTKQDDSPTFEGSNLSRDAHQQDKVANKSQWYNPVSWFR